MKSIDDCDLMSNLFFLGALRTIALKWAFDIMWYVVMKSSKCCFVIWYKIHLKQYKNCQSHTHKTIHTKYEETPKDTLSL